MASLIAEYPKTGIHIVIIGAGFGGLTAAIEATLKGHTVEVLEKNPRWEQLGDIISISPNAGQVISRWDRTQVSDRLRKLCMNHKHFRVHTHDGEHVLDQPAYPANDEKPMFNGHRADIHRVFYEYALSLGIPIRLGKRIVSYHEDPAQAKAWVVTETGETYKGDVVIGADGVRSRARKLVLGYDDKPVSSGYAVYRAWFDAEKAGIYDDPLTREFVMNGDTHTGWLGKDIHLLVATCKGGKEISWVCTHRDDSDIDESWSNPGQVKDVLALLDGWDPRVRAIISRTPSCVDWKLVSRDPLPTWVTPAGYMCLLGDAAHPFLPTSVQGCSQAIEDGCVLATSLALSHAATRTSPTSPTSTVPTALRAYEALRRTRVRHAQLSGEAVRAKWHSVDWSRVKANPEMVKLPRADWLLRHDAEKFTRRMWKRAASGLEMPLEMLAAGPESVELLVDEWEMPPSPVETPREELERRLA
ncbi:hypothetical protein EDC01DRAFT_774719 [Geopyxis carbonaria]|nr:hypothetical protein EDC01DRAFT_774719 [Geopyxis carbonaria]